jgi:hypothetical protein
MNYLKYLLIFLVLQLGAEEQLRFINGDKWVGELNKFNKDTLTLKSELSDKILPLKVSNLTSIIFPKNDLKFKNNVSVHLTNGDTIVGDFLGMDEKQLSVDTTFAGVLQLPKETIKHLHYNSKKTSLQSAETLWPDTYSPYKTLLNLRTPFQFKHPTLIEADISGTTTSFTFRLSGRNADRSRSHSLSTTLRKYGDNVRAYAYIYNSPDNKRADKAIKTVSSNFKVKIYINYQKGLFLFYVNNEEIATFDLDSKVDWQNTTMYITTRGNTIVNSLNVNKWSGKKTMIRQTELANKVDAKINLKNGDVAYGQISNIGKEKLRFKSVLGDLTIPLARVDQITLPNPEVPQGSNNFTLSKGPLRISGNVVYESGMLEISNSYLSKVKLKKEHFRTLNRYMKPQKFQPLPTIDIGESTVKGKVLHLKDGLLNIQNDNLIGEQDLSSQKLKSIWFSGSSRAHHGQIGITRFNVNTNNSNIKTWTVELTNGDTFKTTNYFLNKKVLTLHLGTIPLTIPLTQIKTIKPSQRLNRNPLFLKNLPDRYSLNFRLNLTNYALDMLKDNDSTNALFYFNCRTTTLRSIYFHFSSEVITLSSSVNRKPTKWEVKSHNKMIFKKQNDFQIKIDHEKNRLEIWGNNKLINSTTGEIGGKFSYIDANARNRKYAILDKASFRPWDNDIKSKSYILDTKMNIHEGSITTIDQEQVKINDKNILLKDIYEITLGHEEVKPAKNSRAIITTKNGTFHVDHLTIEDSDLFFSLGNNKNLFLPLNALSNITFINE